jgi:tetratricopeptide (TPR) repeat protein
MLLFAPVVSLPMSARELKIKPKQRAVADVAPAVRTPVERAIKHSLFLAIAIANTSLACLAVPQKDFALLKNNIQHMIAEKHYEESIPLLEQVVQFKVTPANKEAIANAEYSLGRFYFDCQGNNEKAEEHITKAILLKPKTLQEYDLYYLRGVYRSQLNHFADSAKDLSYSLKLKPNNTLCLYRLGNAYCLIKEDAKALEIYSKVISLVPTTDPLYRKCLFGRAQIYQKTNQYQKAIDDFTALSKVSLPEGLYLPRANCYEKLHQYDKAMADYNHMTEYDPDNDDVYRKRADLYLVLGKTKEAFKDYDQAIKLSPSPTNYRTRAAAYAKMGRKDLAALDKKKAGD